MNQLFRTLLLKVEKLQKLSLLTGSAIVLSIFSAYAMVPGDETDGGGYTSLTSPAGLTGALESVESQDGGRQASSRGNASTTREDIGKGCCKKTQKCCWDNFHRICISFIVVTILTVVITAVVLKS